MKIETDHEKVTLIPENECEKKHLRGILRGIPDDDLENFFPGGPVAVLRDDGVVEIPVRLRPIRESGTKAPITRLKLAMVKAGLQGYKTAEKSGLSETVLSRITTGRRRASEEEQKRLSEALELSKEELFDDEGFALS